ncbi:MAG: App1 family protein [Pirellulales bacterium]|nr:App1 family protein [Pirellulales bacterium]
MRTFPSFFLLILFSVTVLGTGCGRDSDGKPKGRVPSGNEQSAPGSLNATEPATATEKSDISFDETVVLFPTYAHLDEKGGTWTVPIHGRIFEPEGNSIRRRAMLESVAQTLGVEDGSAEADMLRHRLGLFLVDNERGKEIFVRMGEKVYAVGTSDADGHFGEELRLSADEVEELLGEGSRDEKQRDGKDGDRRLLSYRVVVDEADERSFHGRVQVIGSEGYSVISDIDDTIKHSQVTDSKALLTNTFLRNFESVAGMSELYQQWAQKGVVFHYVSGSPWQLYPPLSKFLAEEGFPDGSFDLKNFRLKDPSSLGLLGSQESHKLAAIEPIMTAFPRRRFILVGDSGEQDPEIYATVARKYPEQVAAIFIRNVTTAKDDDARFEAVCKGLGGISFVLFEDAETLGPAVEKIMGGHKSD